VALAADGEPSLLIVEGAAGLGKSALLTEARRSIEPSDEVTVLFGRPGEFEASFAYGVVRQLLGPGLAGDARDSLLAGPAGGAVLALEDQPGDAPPFDSSFGILDSLYWMTANMAAQGPVAILVDDAHWADPPSLRFLSHLLRRVEGLPVAMVLALRPSEPNAPHGLLDALRLDPLAEVVTLDPLSEGASASIVRERVSAPADAEFCRACHRASSGNPLYLLELVRALEKEEVRPSRDAVERVAGVWPASVARHVLRRVAGHGPEAASLASAMAVLGDGATLVHAGKVAGLEVGDASRLARALRDMDVLADEDPVRFSHPVVRLALASGLTRAKRDELLRTAVAVLSDDGAPPEQAGKHLLALTPGGGHPIEPLRRAASEARGRGAPDLAVTFLRRALAEPPSDPDLVGVLRELGVAEEMIGSEACLEHLTAARDASADPADRLELTLSLCNGLMMLGRVPEGVAEIERELDGEHGHGEEERELLEAHVCVTAFWVSDESPRAQELLQQFEREPPRGDAARRLVLATRAAQFALTAEENAALAREALDGDALITAPWIGNLLAIAALITSDDFDAASDVLDRAMELGRLSGNERAIGNFLSLRATLSYAIGDLAGGETQIRTHLGPLRGEMNWAAAAYSVSVLVKLLTRRGAFDEAEALLAEGDPEPWPASTNLQYFLRSARGELRCAQGRYEEGVADLAAAREALMRFNSYSGAPFAVYGENEPLALDRLGRRAEAEALVTEGLARARECRSPRNLAAVLRVGGLLEGGSAGVDQLTEAVAILEDSGAELELGQALVDLGMLLRHSGDRVAARAKLAQGLDLAIRCGAAPLAERAREELAASGARPRRDRVTGRDSLTPSELRLARLAATGQSNRSIAQELYLSEKTVEMHLGRAYRKLGIGGRKELSAALEGREEAGVS
jgi:DNA-binding CsgD family transcriptional regulator